MPHRTATRLPFVLVLFFLGLNLGKKVFKDGVNLCGKWGKKMGIATIA